MMNPLNFNLASLGAPAATPGKAAPVAPSQGPIMVRMPKDSWERSGSDDYARRHAEAFAPKAPPKSDSGMPKLGLGIQIDDSLRIDLKPSLKKGGSFKIELRKSF